MAFKSKMYMLKKYWMTYNYDLERDSFLIELLLLLSMDMDILQMCLGIRL